MPSVTPQQGQIGFEHKGIGSVLAHTRLAVPLNQREYSWEDEHVEELLQDFSNAIENNHGAYFLGTIVLIADILPSDTLFQTAFSEARISQGHLARYYLRALD